MVYKKQMFESLYLQSVRTNAFRVVQLVVFQLALASLVAVAGGPPVIVDAERSPGGKMRLAMAPSPGGYFVLRRHAELTNRPGRAVAVAQSGAGQTWITDSAFTKKGHDYLHIEVHDSNGALQPAQSRHRDRSAGRHRPDSEPGRVRTPLEPRQPPRRPIGA